MKKILSFLLILSILTLSGCSFDFFGSKPALVISGTEISREIYNYYLDKVKGRPGDYGLSDNPDDNALKETTTSLCMRYLAINTNFASASLTLSASDKAEIADKVNNYWIRFENHYNEIGVSKQTITKIFTSEAFEDAMFEYYFDKGTDNKTGETAIKEYYYSEYVAIRTICAYFTQDNNSHISETEKQKIVDTFNYIVTQSGTDSDSFTTACSDAGYTASDIIVISSDSEGYPSGFYDSVSGQAENSIKLIIYGDCIFAVRKESLSQLGESVYADYRSTCIKKLYQEEWQEMVDGYISQLKVEKSNV